MARVNIEDDLDYSGRLGKLARTLGWCEFKAMGALVYFYRDTQRAGIVEANEDRIVTVTVLRHDSDEDARQFLYAVISAQLAERLEDGRIRIKGNDKHVDRMEQLRELASDGGKARQAKKRNKFQAVTAANQAVSQATRSAPSSQLLTPNSNTEETTKNNTTPEVTKPKRKSTSPEAAPSGVAQVRRVWLHEYQKRYDGKSYPWGAREGGQTRVLLGSWPLNELIELIPLFFAWARPEVIRSGHAFGTGIWSFTMRLHELRADLIDPKRRATAAQVQKRERNDNETAEQQDQIARVLARMEERNGPARIDGTDFTPARDSQPKNLGQGAFGMGGQLAGFQGGSCTASG